MTRIGYFCTTTLFLCLITSAIAFEVREFSSEQHRLQYKQLIGELRCLVCQNQSLADSDAPLALDLRDIVFDMTSEGVSENEIIAFLTARYGDFILYKPPLNIKTVLLWGMPLLLMLIGMAVFILFINKSRKNLQMIENSRISR